MWKVRECRSQTQARVERKGQARSPHYFVQITLAAVICEIPVILHFKLENKTAQLAAAYPSSAISIVSPPVTLTLLQAKHDCSENYCTTLCGVSIIFSRLLPFYFPFLPPTHNHLLFFDLSCVLSSFIYISSLLVCMHKILKRRFNSSIRSGGARLKVRKFYR